MENNNTLKKRVQNQSIVIKKLRKKIKSLEKEIYELNDAKKNVKTRLRIKDIAEIYSISESTAYEWVKKGNLTPIKVTPRITLYQVKEIEEFLIESGRKKAPSIVPTNTKSSNLKEKNTADARRIAFKGGPKTPKFLGKHHNYRLFKKHLDSIGK